MSELQFPKNPIVGQEYDFAPYKYYWDGVKWKTKGIGYNPVNDLRDELEPRISDNESKVFEALRRSYADAGLNLVEGSFEEGGALLVASDVMITASGDGYSWGGTEFPHNVEPDTDPTAPDSGYVPRTDVVLRDELSDDNGASLIGIGNNRTQHDKNNELRSILDDGAIGGGINDDTTAINSGNANIRCLPSGVYKYNQATGGAEWFARNLVANSDVRFNGTGCVNFTSTYKYPKLASLAAKLAAGNPVEFDIHGDSLMFGATVGNLTVQSAMHPGVSLRNALLLAYGVTCTVNNRAIGGTKIGGMLTGFDGSGKTFAAWMDLSTAEAVFCDHCTNDFQDGTPIADYRRDLLTFVSTVRSRGKIPVLVTPPSYAPVSIGTADKSIRSTAYINVMREVANLTNCDLVDNAYWFKQSEKNRKVTSFIGDGVHLTDAGYRQFGYNLAIPLVTAQTITNDGDIAGIANTSIRSNFTSTTFATWGCRSGVAAIVTREAGKSIAFPFITESPLTKIGLIGSKINNGAICDWGVNGESTTSINQYRHYGSTENQDELYEIPCDCLAGLNFAICIFKPSQTDPAKNAMVFGGVQLPRNHGSAFGNRSAPYAKFGELMGIGRKCLVSTGQLPLSSYPIVLVDDNANVVQMISFSGGTITTAMYRDGSAVDTVTIATGQTDGPATVEISWSETAATVIFGTITKTHSFGENRPPMCGINRHKMDVGFL